MLLWCSAITKPPTYTALYHAKDIPSQSIKGLAKDHSSGAASPQMLSQSLMGLLVSQSIKTPLTRNKIYYWGSSYTIVVVAQRKMCDIYFKVPRNIRNQCIILDSDWGNFCSNTWLCRYEALPYKALIWVTQKIFNRDRLRTKFNLYFQRFVWVFVILGESE